MNTVVDLTFIYQLQKLRREISSSSQGSQHKHTFLARGRNQSYDSTSDTDTRSSLVIRR
jgi:hypothetical protein